MNRLFRSQNDLHNRDSNIELTESDAEEHFKLEWYFKSTKELRSLQKNMIGSINTVVYSGKDFLAHEKKFSDMNYSYGMVSLHSGDVMGNSVLRYVASSKEIDDMRLKMLKYLDEEATLSIRQHAEGIARDEGPKKIKEMYRQMRERVRNQNVEVAKWEARLRKGRGNTPELQTRLQTHRAALDSLIQELRAYRTRALSSMEIIEAEAQKSTRAALVKIVGAQEDFCRRSALVLGNLKAKLEVNLGSTKSTQGPVTVGNETARTYASPGNNSPPSYDPVIRSSSLGVQFAKFRQLTAKLDVASRSLRESLKQADTDSVGSSDDSDLDDQKSWQSPASRQPANEYLETIGTVSERSIASSYPRQDFSLEAGNDSGSNPGSEYPETIFASEPATCEILTTTIGSDTASEYLEGNVASEVTNEDIYEMYVVHCPYNDMTSDKLQLRAGERVVVVDKTNSSGWWRGYIFGDPGRVGWFPKSFVSRT